jgi:hypothetical protein
MGDPTGLYLSAGVGSFFRCAISGKKIRFVGYAFIDDMDLIQTAHGHITTESQVLAELQKTADIWEGGLRASGVPWFQKKAIGAL